MKKSLSVESCDKVSQIATVFDSLEETGISGKLNTNVSNTQRGVWCTRDCAGPPVYRVYNCLLLISSHSVKYGGHLFCATLEPIKVCFRTSFAVSYSLVAYCCDQLLSG